MPRRSGDWLGLTLQRRGGGQRSSDPWSSHEVAGDLGQGSFGGAGERRTEGRLGERVM